MGIYITKIKQCCVINYDKTYLSQPLTTKLNQIFLI